MFLLPFHVVGCSHERNTSDAVGHLRIAPERLTELLAELGAAGHHAVIVSTCHRTELYWWGDEELQPWFVQRVLGEQASALCIERADADLAVRHLFSVAAGMRSARYGESEILGQLRRACTAARAAGTSHGPLDGAFRQAIDAGRHIRQAMGSDADATLGQQVRARIATAVDDVGAAEVPVLLVGSGDAARSVLEALREAPVPAASVRLVSRTRSRAEALADRYTVPVLDWEAHRHAIATTPVVVFAVHVTTPLADLDVARAAMTASGPHRPLWIDLGVPGAVAPAVRADGIELVTLAELAGRPLSAVAEERARRAGLALQHELARYARTTHRLQLGERLGTLEARAIAVAAEHGSAPVDEVARRVTRLVLRELTRA